MLFCSNDCSKIFRFEIVGYFFDYLQGTVNEYLSVKITDKRFLCPHLGMFNLNYNGDGFLFVMVHPYLIYTLLLRLNNSVPKNFYQAFLSQRFSFVIKSITQLLEKVSKNNTLS